MSTFKTFDNSDVVTGRIQSVSEGLFPDGNPTQNQELLFRSDTQIQTQGTSKFDVKSGLYYNDVYSSDPNQDDSISDIVFSVSYGHVAGTGSSDEDRTDLKIFPTKAVYTQYKNLILTPDDDKFTFASGVGGVSELIDADEIYIINFATSKFKEKVDAGLLEFSLSGSNGVFTFVDESVADSVNGTLVKKSSYNIVSGSLETDTSSAQASTPQGFGMFYPSLGVIVLNATKLGEVVGGLGGDDGTATEFALNHQKLFNALNFNGKTMKVRATEFIPSRQYFIRVKNQEFNYSNNPTFVKTNDDGATSTDEGRIRFQEFYNDPKVYLTTVGLYDDENELVAVAKLSQPFQKSFDNEALIKVKINT